ncbi:hypothetical protein PPOP_3478, partial [Paenibacillus popilliae ATCC 14706]
FLCNFIMGMGINDEYQFGEAG